MPIPIPAAMLVHGGVSVNCLVSLVQVIYPMRTLAVHQLKGSAGEDELALVQHHSKDSTLAPFILKHVVERQRRERSRLGDVALPSRTSTAATFHAKLFVPTHLDLQS